MGSSIWKNRVIYILLLPGLTWYIIFTYMPMAGLSLAFKDFRANLGIWKSPFAGLHYFKILFVDAAFWRSFWKTIYINIGRMIFQFPAPVLLALLINEFRSRRYKRILQTIYTFPHFFSWIIVSSIVINFLGQNGFVNNILVDITGKPVRFLGSTTLFIPMLYITEIWKSSGYGAIIYLAAIAGVDQEQYEAAFLDGATRMQQIFHITLPNIMPTIMVMFILTSGGLMTMGFDQIFNMSNAAVKDTAEVMDMYIYRITFQGGTDFSFSSAVSLFRSVLNMLFLLAANQLSKMMGGGGLINTREEI